MNRAKIYKYLFFTFKSIAFILITSCGSKYQACSGESDCNICKDYSRYKYCNKDGGTCGVCK